MNTILEIIDYLQELNTASVLLRLTLAVLCGGLIGIERGRKHRPAGFRTYMLVCLGSTLTLLISQYVSFELGQSTDITRLAAQVINGIGFLGVGTIIVTRHQQVKGLTTAAGLWASACMGIAIGAGFYLASFVACLLIILVLTVLAKIETTIMSMAKTMNISVGYETNDDIVTVIDKIKSLNVSIIDVEIVRINTGSQATPSAILSLRLPKRKGHAELMEALANIDSVIFVEEI